MKTLRLTVLGLGAAAALLTAEVDTKFVGWMKTVGGANGALRKMEKKASKEAIGEAERISGVYEEMIGYWRQRNAADAVKASETGKAAAVALASAANAGDEAKATEALNTLAGTCKTCHEAHRDKTPDGKYIIK